MKHVFPIFLVLASILTACSTSPTEEELLRSIPIPPQASTPRQSGSMMEFSVPDACPESASFYEAQMGAQGWINTSTNGDGSLWLSVKYTKNRDTVEINLSKGSTSSNKCHIQIFYHKYSSIDTGIPQRVTGIIIILFFQGLFALGGGLAAKGKGRNPILGILLGFFLGFLGDFFILTLEPRRDFQGRMIGWDEYKKMSKEQRENLIAKPAAPAPESKRRKILFIILIVILVVVMAVVILQNLAN